MAGYGPKRLYKDRRDNVGKGHLPAGARSNLQRPAEIGEPKSAGGFWSGARASMSDEGRVMPTEAVQDTVPANDNTICRAKGLSVSSGHQ